MIWNNTLLTTTAALSFDILKAMRISSKRKQKGIDIKATKTMAAVDMILQVNQLTGLDLEFRELSESVLTKVLYGFEAIRFGYSIKDYESLLIIMNESQGFIKNLNEIVDRVRSRNCEMNMDKILKNHKYFMKASLEFILNPENNIIDTKHFNIIRKD